jgi:arsenite methyltransferase
MQYLNKTYDWSKDDLVSQYDELSLWSSQFGLLLMDNFPLGRYENYLDVACGTGFPLIDIAQRLGAECKSYGVDPWVAAVKRARSKIETLGLFNVKIIEGSASQMSFPDNHFDLITSNLGINNFSDPFAVLTECNRVLKQGASLCITTNLTGHFQEFYDIYGRTLEELDLFEKYCSKLIEHINHRGTVESISSLLKKAGFTIKEVIDSRFAFRYLDGTSFLNHSFIMSAFMESWRSIIDENERVPFFTKLEENLNRYAELNDGLEVTVPAVYIECEK